MAYSLTVRQKGEFNRSNVENINGNIRRRQRHNRSVLFFAVAVIFKAVASFFFLLAALPEMKNE
jgi:hypothetical protein